MIIVVVSLQHFGLARWPHSRVDFYGHWQADAVQLILQSKCFQNVQGLLTEAEPLQPCVAV